MMDCTEAGAEAGAKARAGVRAGAALAAPVVRAEHTTAMQGADDGLQRRDLALAVRDGFLVQDERLRVQIAKQHSASQHVDVDVFSSACWKC
jgi:hypothetical protein